jgi:cellulose synthase operon protein C
MMARLLAFALLLFFSTFGCASRPARPAQLPLADLRKSGASSDDPELVGSWLFAELVRPGGDAAHGRRARERLDRMGGGGMVADLARGLDDSVHGRLRTAPDHYLSAVQKARVSSDPRAPFVAWFAAHSALAGRLDSAHLWRRWRPFVEEAIRSPLALGWRARGELVEWWIDEAYAGATKDVDELAAEHYGCAGELRLAGPFGRSAAADSYRSFAAESPGPWPERWKPDGARAEAPRVLTTERRGCMFAVDEPVGAGVFYAETYIDLPASREVLIAVQGALAVWVDDELVLDRDPRRWGVWPKFGVQLWLPAGRHRVLARLMDAQTSIRLLHPDGRPLLVESSGDAAAPYSLVPPQISGEPNLLSRLIRPDGVIDPGDEVTRFTAAYLAWVEGQGDVASVMMEPLLVQPERATGPVLTFAAVFSEKDPIFNQTQTRDLIRELHERAVKKDPGLWQPQLSLALWEAERAGPKEAVRGVRVLVDRFPDVPAVIAALVRLYGELGWSAEYSLTAKQLAERFPDNVEALSTAVGVYDQHGAFAKADALVARIQKLDPDSEIVLTRALARADYPGALAELRRLGNRRPDRKDIAERVYDVMVRGGKLSESWKKLEAAIEQNPKDGRARLALADAQFASGKPDALRAMLLESMVEGAGTAELEQAIDLVEGTTELEPYRLDARKIIRDYEQAGRHMPGTAARVLDYAAVWIHADGSSRMLEHEVIRVQSAEAIGKLAEHPRLEGLPLHMRVIKADGRVLEPEFVAGKPTVTLPHLEVGDYIETEQILTLRSGDRFGSLYVGPQWFFREENIAYARSEFVVIAPDSKPLQIETRGNVPEPEVEKMPGLVIRRWRVDDSPAAPVEPGSAPISEFLPSVRLAWGVRLDQRIQAIADTLAEVTPLDPRIRRIARKIAAPLPADAKRERAKRLYRWVLANVEDGPETDGRRVIIGKQGNRWKGFIALCRALGIRADYAIARNRLAEPPVGPIARAGQFTEPALRLMTERGPVWLTVSNKFAPFGYLPAEIRGVPAYVLEAKGPRKVTTPAGGSSDGVRYEGTAELSADGSARVELVLVFEGKYAMGLRDAIAQLPEPQLRDVIESKLLGRALRGARLLHYFVEHRDDLDKPLRIKSSVEVGGFAQPIGGKLVLSPPFTPRISQLASLPTRQTPLLLTDATHQEVSLAITLPKGARLDGSLVNATIADGDRTLVVSDQLRDGTLMLRRTLDLPAGRVQPDAYPKFVQFARRADDAMSANVQIRLR